MSNWHLPPKYIEFFDSCNDIFKELLIKCKYKYKFFIKNVLKNINKNLHSFKITRRPTKKNHAKI
jgi:hypothetical protein